MNNKDSEKDFVYTVMRTNLRNDRDTRNRAIALKMITWFRYVISMFGGEEETGWLIPWDFVMIRDKGVVELHLHVLCVSTQVHSRRDRDGKCGIEYDYIVISWDNLGIRKTSGRFFGARERPFINLWRKCWGPDMARLFWTWCSALENEKQDAYVCIDHGS